MLWSAYESASASMSSTPSISAASAKSDLSALASRMCSCTACPAQKRLQKALAQLKLAFDNLDKLRPGVSREVVTQMFELVVNSKNPAVNSLMPPTVAALASLSLHDQQQQAAAIATPGLAPHHHRAAPPDGHPPPA